MRGALSTPAILIICAILWAVLIWRVASDRKGPEAFEPTVPQNEIQAFAMQKLSALQYRSFSEGIELCGVIFEDNTGALTSSETTVGDEASCDLAYYDEPGMAPVASFHTHGAFGSEYDSEVPSTDDLQSDFEGQMDGYISTPAGRLWHVDWTRETATEVCGPGCLPADPQFRPCLGDNLSRQYTLDDLFARSEMDLTLC